jgi:hypothetical protein
MQYLKNLEAGVISILNISAEWQVKATDLSISRRLGQTGYAAICLVFISSTADTTAFTLLRNKLNSQAFLDALNTQGFLASKSLQQVTDASAGGNELQSSVIIGVSLASGISSVLIFGFFYRWLSRRRGFDGKSGSLDDDKKGIVVDGYREVGLWAENGSMPGKHIPDSNEYTKVASNQGSSSDYAVELEEVLQLIAKLGIRIKSLLDSH